jgi:hypothetical protein
MSREPHMGYKERDSHKLKKIKEAFRCLQVCMLEAPVEKITLLKPTTFPLPVLGHVGLRWNSLR